MYAHVKLIMLAVFTFYSSDFWCSYYWKMACAYNQDLRWLTRMCL